MQLGPGSRCAGVVRGETRRQGSMVTASAQHFLVCHGLGMGYSNSGCDSQLLAGRVAMSLKNRMSFWSCLFGRSRNDMTVGRFRDIVL